MGDEASKARAPVRCDGYEELRTWLAGGEAATSGARLYYVQASEAGLRLLGERRPRLRSLDLLGREATDRGLKALVERGPRFESLFIYETSITDAGVRAVARRCRRLLHLHLPDVDATDESLEALAERCPRLQTLEIRGSGVTDRGLRALSQGCTRLRSLQLVDASATDPGVRAVAQGCRRLKSLWLEGMRTTDVGLRAVAEHCPRLQTLGVEGPGVTDAGLRAIAKGCRRLERLRLSDAAATDVGLRAVAGRCPRLEALSLSNTAVAGEGLRGVAERLPRLRSLHLCETPVGDAGLQAVAEHCNGLAMLELERTAATDVGLQAAAEGCPKLETLRLVEPAVTDFGVRAIVQRRPRLRTVHLGGMRRLTDDSLRAVAEGCPQLNFLDMAGTQATDHGVQALAERCKRLIFLDLRGTMVGLPETLKNSMDAQAVLQFFSEAREPGGRKLLESEQQPSRRVLGASLDGPLPQNFHKVHAWVAGRPGEELAAFPAFERSLELATFYEACKAAGQPDARQQRLWLLTLHALGLLHHLGERASASRAAAAGLQEHVYHPRWIEALAQGAAASPELDERTGLLKGGALRRAVAPLAPDEAERRRGVALLEACERIFLVRDGKGRKSRWLVVDRVPSRPAGWVRSDWPAYPKKRLRWKFPSLPDRLTPQLLGRWFSHRPAEAPYFSDDLVLASSHDGTCRVRLQARDDAIDLEFDAECEVDWERLAGRLESEVESILDPERIRCCDGDPLWSESDST